MVDDHPPHHITSAFVRSESGSGKCLLGAAELRTDEPVAVHGRVLTAEHLLER